MGRINDQIMFSRATRSDAEGSEWVKRTSQKRGVDRSFIIFSVDWSVSFSIKPRPQIIIPAAKSKPL
jgi:hypothetical protein